MYGLSQASILEKLGTALLPLSTTGNPSPEQNEQSLLSIRGYY